MSFHRSASPVSRHKYSIIPTLVLIRLGIVEYQRAGQVRNGGDVRPAGQVSGCLNVKSLVDPTLDLERARALRYQPGRFGYGQDLVRSHVLQFLHDARRPFDAKGVHRGGVAQAEVGAEMPKACTEPSRGLLSGHEQERDHG